jgi:hypothetical protein
LLVVVLLVVVLLTSPKSPLADGIGSGAGVHPIASADNNTASTNSRFTSFSSTIKWVT